MEFTKEISNSLIEEISKARRILLQGRMYGIRIIATKDAYQCLKIADHPDRDEVLCNLLITDHDFGSRPCTDIRFSENPKEGKHFPS